MSEDRRFYVYMYFRRDGSPLYVGKGCGRRWLHHTMPNTKNTNVYFRRVLAKEGLDIPRLKIRENLTNTEAVATEIALIAAIGRHVDGGPLVNMSLGGDGVPGCRMSEKTRALIIAANTGRVHSAEAKAKMSAARKGLKKTAEHRAKIGAKHVGRVRSVAEVEKLRAAGCRNADRHRQSAKRQHKNMSDEQKAARSARISAAVKAAMARPEVKARVRAAAAKRPPPPPNRGRTGIPHDDETRAKMAAAWAKRKAAGYVKPRHSAEARAKMSASHQRNAELRREAKNGVAHAKQSDV